MGRGSLKEKIKRQEVLLSALRSQVFWTSSELSQHLNTSYRTLMRDLSELKERGYPIESERGRGGGISLRGRWGVEKLHLNNSEVISLILSMAITERLKSPILMKDLHSIRKRIALALPEHQRKAVTTIRQRIFTGEVASKEVVENYQGPKQRILEVLANCFFSKNKVSIKYISGTGDRTERTIEPQLILLNWPIWYFCSWDELRNDVRLFRIDRILSANQIDQTFKLRNPSTLLRGMTEYFQSI